MGQAVRKYKQRKDTKEQLKILQDNAKTVLVIHYSCESFYDITDGRSPRITSIGVRNWNSGQTNSFSIHLAAEKQKIKFAEISKYYDKLEKDMLDAFFDFVSRNIHCYWIHWNMRDSNYGFAALEHKHRILEGSPIQIPEEKKFDLSRALVAIYGISYISHPRLPNLVKLNRITNKDMLSGEEEAQAFNEKEFIKLHQSTLRKIDILANILERTVDKSIKTETKWYKNISFHPQIIMDIIKNHWGYSAIGAILLIAGLYKLIKPLY